MSARVAPLVLTAASLLAACSHHTPPATAPAPQQQAAAPTPPAAPAPTPAPSPVAKVDDSAIRSALTQMTFFAFDKSELSGQDQTTLAAKVPILAANPTVAIRVAGNCDDRGSDEYNLALGQRRAESAKRYLTEHGIATTRIATISYGKEHPISAGDSEASWAQNRNDQFEITSGAGVLQAPQTN
ncbi:MAG TPA: OmpA family protein [Gemmatimonadaceae bacterium]|nr:OmpA family protein [Gemmatimonadaceae bacterium]